MFGASPLDNFRNQPSCEEKGAAVRRGILADALEQFARVNLERTGELHDIFNSEVAFAAFDPADVSRMNIRFFGKPFLRPLLFQSQLPNSFTK